MHAISNNQMWVGLSVCITQGQRVLEPLRSFLSHFSTVSCNSEICYSQASVKGTGRYEFLHTRIALCVMLPATGGPSSGVHLHRHRLVNCVRWSVCRYGGTRCLSEIGSWWKGSNICELLLLG